MDGYKAGLGVVLMKWVRSSACVTVYNEFIVWAGSGSLMGFNLISLFYMGWVKLFLVGKHCGVAN